MKKWNNPCLENLNLSSTKAHDKPEGCTANKARPGQKCPNTQSGPAPSCGYFIQDADGNPNTSSGMCNAPAGGNAPGDGGFEDIPGISG